MSTMCSSHVTRGCVHKQPIPQRVGKLKSSLSSTLKPFLQNLEHIPQMRTQFSKNIKDASMSLLDGFVDYVFQFVDQPFLPSQKNFAPVEEIGDVVQIDHIEGQIPIDFPQGVYIRNGANPLFGGLKSTVSMLGKSSSMWVEGEGMLHALYLTKDEENNNGNWTISYNNRFVETNTYKMEKKRNKPSFLPTIEGDSWVILASILLNLLRFGELTKTLSNTNVFDHGGKYYSITEDSLPQEIDICSLKTLDDWNPGNAWSRPFTSHPKKAPGSGELVTIGADVLKPYYVVGVISADGKKLLHNVDVKLRRSIISHDMGVTEKYNIILDYPLLFNIRNLIQGGQLLSFGKDQYAKIGVMPRKGNADSVKWFEVELYCAFHILNCFEDGDEVVVRGCKAKTSIIPGPDWGEDKFKWFSRGFKPNTGASNEEILSNSPREGSLFTCVYEWRLNMVTGEVNERNLSGNEFSMDFPIINEDFTGVRHKYGYTQVIDSESSSASGISKYGSLAKLYLEETSSSSYVEGQTEKQIKVVYHDLGKNNFCTGSTFVARRGTTKEDDGWIVSFVHDEDTDVSHVIVIDAKNFEDAPIAKIFLPQRVPYGHHGGIFSYSKIGIAIRSDPIRDPDDPILMDPNRIRSNLK